MTNLENIALFICVLLLLETVFELIFIFVDTASKVAIGTVGVTFKIPSGNSQPFNDRDESVFYF